MLKKNTVYQLLQLVSKHTPVQFTVTNGLTNVIPYYFKCDEDKFSDQRCSKENSTVSYGKAITSPTTGNIQSRN